MTQIKTTNFKRTRLVAIMALGLFLSGLIINFFRKELFGIIPGYAPHNFGFNFIFFIPLNLIVIGLCLYIITKTLLNWNIGTDRKEKIQTLCLTIPIIFGWIFQVVRIMML